MKRKKSNLDLVFKIFGKRYRIYYNSPLYNLIIFLGVVGSVAAFLAVYILAFIVAGV